MKRRRLSKKVSKRVFRATSNVHPKNTKPMPMRGGIRA